MGTRLRWGLGPFCAGIVLMLTISPRASQVIDTPDSLVREWPCYDPKPGHPTMEEKEVFLSRILPSARIAEKQVGTPAAALIAMSMLESGYGWTRTALYADNYFGYKFTSSKAAGARQAWPLSCQPANDPNNKYIKFRDLEDSVIFVAGRLASSPRYKKATDRYREASKSAATISKAVDQWIEQVSASGYNPDPDYPKRVERILHNYIAPSDIVSQKFGLYSVSQQP